jgi:excisionase family DNA binding protein
MAKVSRRDEVSRLLESGLSYAEIGRRWGISRQRVWQIARRGPERDPRPKVVLTTGDVAQFLSVPPNTVRYWSDKGMLKSHRIGPRGDRRFRREDIDNFIKRR